MNLKEALLEKKSGTHRKKTRVIAGICPTHGYWKGERCERCSEEVKEGAPQVMLFTPYLYEDLDVEPIYITSKRQLKEECKKRGLIAARLL